MKTPFLKLAISVFLSVGFFAESFAQWASGEIRRVDPENMRLTIKHGEIPSLDMPPMTMVFYVKDKALLSGLAAQDKIEFQAMTEGKRYIVTEIRKTP